MLLNGLTVVGRLCVQDVRRGDDARRASPPYADPPTGLPKLGRGVVMDADSWRLGTAAGPRRSHAVEGWPARFVDALRVTCFVALAAGPGPWQRPGAPMS